MNFSDLFKRILTASIMILVFLSWLYLSEMMPTVFFLGIACLAAVCGYEWWNMARKSTALRLKYAGFLAIGVGFASWIYVHTCIGMGGTTLIVCTAFFSDTMAYFGGRILQGPKLCPAISPSKTWAGCLSSLILGPLWTMWIIAFYSPRYSWALWGGLALLFAAAQIGDLLESWAKRIFKTKDSGSWLPGHGGLLDRLDSILAISVVLAVFVYTYFNYFH